MTPLEPLYDGHSVGLEKEFYVVDGSNSTEYESQLVPLVKERMRREMDSYDDEVGPKCYLDASGPVEVTTRPCKDLAKLTDDVCTAYGIAKEEADKRGLYALGLGNRPGTSNDNAGLHVHVGFRDEDEARYVFNALQTHVPDIMALSANSPSQGGWVKDMRMYGDLVVRFMSGLLKQRGFRYGHEFDPFEDTSRLSVIYKRENTVEVRCMDSQGTPEEDAAVAAYIFGIAEKAKDEMRRGVPMPEAGGEERANFDRAVRDGMEATFRLDGERVPSYKVVEGTLEEIRPYLKRYKCPEKVVSVLEDRVERRRSGADDVADLYEAAGRPFGAFAAVAELFGSRPRREELLDALAHREKADALLADEAEEEDAAA